MGYIFIVINRKLMTRTFEELSFINGQQTLLFHYT